MVGVVCSYMYTYFVDNGPTLILFFQWFVRTRSDSGRLGHSGPDAFIAGCDGLIEVCGM